MISKKNSIPNKGENYLYAQDKFYEQFNDFKFFIEDEDSENLYYIILKKLFPKIQLNKIFPLGGKVKVLSHAAENAGNSFHIYLVDKDFDDILETKVSLPSLFYLEKYEIENYFYENNAILKFIVSMRPRIKIDNLEFQNKLGIYLKSVMKDLNKLFLLFFLVQLQEVKIKNVQNSPEKFFNRKDCCIDQAEISAFEHKVVSTYNLDLKVYEKKFSKEFELNKKVRFNGNNISGKYLLYSIKEFISKKYGLSSVQTDSFIYRLCEYCELISLSAIKLKMEKYLKAS